METRKFEHFKNRARIFFSDEDSVTPEERRLVRFIFAHSESILKRARKKLKQEWPAFEEDFKVDPFGEHAGVEIHLYAADRPSGRWTLLIYWVPDESWAGMHLYFEFVFDKLRDFAPVF